MQHNNYESDYQTLPPQAMRNQEWEKYVKEDPTDERDYFNLNPRYKDDLVQ